MAEWAEKIAQISREVGTIAENDFAADLDFDKVYDLLSKAQIEILLSAPYEVCDCPATDRDCPECSGRRWKTRKTLDVTTLEPQ